jgi:two-component system sensor histidine kinase BaeS
MNDLLELRRPVETKRPVRRRLARFLESVLNTWRDSAEERSDRVQLEIPTGEADPFLEMDPGRMTQVILNLIENALQHSPGNGPVRLYGRACGSDHLCIGVTDRGKGIPQEHMRRLFDPFFTTRPGGSGLGLSVVRYIVERHHGRVTARNNPDGPGATFEIRLPVAPPPGGRTDEDSAGDEG